MKKINYLWGGLMGLAVAASVTGCMQNEEPAGILALRESKSAYIDAETAYKKVDVELQAVKVLREKYYALTDSIKVETERLALEMALAQSEVTKQKYADSMDILAEKQKEKMFDLQAKTAKAQEAYEKARVSLELALATEQDDQVRAKLTNYNYQLSVANSTVTSLMRTYNNAQTTYSTFLTEAEDFEANQTAVVASKKADLDIQKQLLADLEAMEISNDYLADAQAAAKAIEELDVKVAKMKAELIPFSEFQAQNLTEDEIKLGVEKRALIDQQSLLIQEKTALNNELLATQTYTVAKADVTEKMVEDMKLYQVFTTGGYTYFTDGKMVKDFVESASLNSMKNALDGYAESINSNLHGTTDDYTESEIITLKNELDRKKLDIEIRKTDYEADVKDWVKAYNAFDAAVKAYKAYKVANPDYAALQTSVNKQITDYNALAAAKKTSAEANKIIASIKAYSVLRDAVDGSCPTFTNGESKTNKVYEYTVIDKVYYTQAEVDADLTDNITSITQVKNKLAAKQMWLEDFEYNFTVNSSQYLPSSANVNYDYYSAAAKSAVKVYLEAQEVLFGCKYDTTADAYEPTADGKVPADVDGNNHGGTFGAYTQAVTALSIAENIDTYVAFVRVLRDDADAFAAKVIAKDDEIAAKDDEITAKDAEITAKQDEINALQAADSEYKKALNEYWLKEFEIIKLDNLNNGNPSGNPYYVTVTERAVLEAKYTTLKNLLSTGDVYYTIYTNGAYDVRYGSLSTAINNQEGNVTNAEYYYDSALEDLTYFQTYGKIGSQYKETLEKDVADAKVKLDAANELVTYYNNMITKVLGVFAE